MSDELEIVGDAALEARIVAVVLGEASAFEREEIERLCEEQPELAIFRRRIETLHGLLGEEKKQQTTASDEWELSPARRKAIFAQLSEKEAVVETALPQQKTVRPAYLYAAVGCASIAVLAALFVPIFGTAGGDRSLRSSESLASEPDIINYSASTAASGEFEPELLAMESRSRRSQVDAFASQSEPAMESDGVSVSVARKPSAPSSAMSKAIAANTTSPVAIPVPEVDSAVPAHQFGDGDDFGNGWGGAESDGLATEDQSLVVAESTDRHPSADASVESRTNPRFFSQKKSEPDAESQEAWVTGGLRSGASSIDENSIDAFLNAPQPVTGYRWSDSAMEPKEQASSDDPFASAPEDDAFGFLDENSRAEALASNSSAAGLLPPLSDFLPSEEVADLAMADPFASDEGTMGSALAYRLPAAQIEAKTKEVAQSNAEEFAFNWSSNKRDYQNNGKGREAAHVIGTPKGDRSELLAEVDKAWSFGPTAESSLQDELAQVEAELAEAKRGVSNGRAQLVEKKRALLRQRMAQETLPTQSLDEVILPEVNFENITLEAAMQSLAARTDLRFEIDEGALRTLELAGAGDGLLEVALPGGPEIDLLRLRNVPLSKVLEYVTLKTQTRYFLEDGIVKVVPISSTGSADLVTRTWTLGREGYAELMSQAAQKLSADPLSGKEEVPSEQVALELLGISLPQGASVRFLEESGVLLVRSTMQDLDKTEELLTEIAAQVVRAKSLAAMDEKDAASQGDSTFSLHVSDVSFKLAKEALAQGQWPATIRVEEFVNAFDYGETKLAAGERVGVAMEQAAHPFLPQRNLLRLSLQTAATGRGAGVPLNLTVVLDKSGSMERVDRSRAIEEAFRILTEQLNPGDKVTMISFSRQPKLLADQLDGGEGEKLLQILRETPSEGGTNVEEALQLARVKALEHFQPEAQNRVILLTDGIANLGNAVPEELMTLVEGMRKQGIAFDACGVGAEGLNDEILEALTRKGDGRYYLLGRTEDSGADFAKQVAGALRPAAQNVKVQIEWNPDRVGKWRLYGFEKHELKKEDFRNDSVDAAEMAAEEEGVALYHVEVKPDGDGPLGVARVRFLDVASGEMLEREWEIAYQGEALPLSEADPKIRLAGVAGLAAEKLARSAIGERVEWAGLLKELRPLKASFPRQKQVQDLEVLIEQAKNLQGE